MKTHNPQPSLYTPRSGRVYWQMAKEGNRKAEVPDFFVSAPRIFRTPFGYTSSFVVRGTVPFG